MEFVFPLTVLLVSLVIYFLPAIVAGRLNHPYLAGIVVVNLFLGWTLFGWVVALAWAFSPPVCETSIESLPSRRCLPRCPRCNGELDGIPEVCRYCRTELEWIGLEAFTHEQAVASRERLQREQNQRQQEYDEAERQQEEPGERSEAAHAAIKRIAVAMPIAAWTNYNAAIRKAVGDDNELLFHFFRWLVVFVIAAAVVVIAACCLYR